MRLRRVPVGYPPLPPRNASPGSTRRGLHGRRASWRTELPTCSLGWQFRPRWPNFSPQRHGATAAQTAGGESQSVLLSLLAATTRGTVGPPPWRGWRTWTCSSRPNAVWTPPAWQWCHHGGARPGQRSAWYQLGAPVDEQGRRPRRRTPGYGTWPLAPDLHVECSAGCWSGPSDGHCHLLAPELTVQVTGRGAVGQDRRARLRLPLEWSATRTAADVDAISPTVRKPAWDQLLVPRHRDGPLTSSRQTPTMGTRHRPTSEVAREGFGATLSMVHGKCAFTHGARGQALRANPGCVRARESAGRRHTARPCMSRTSARLPHRARASPAPGCPQRPRAMRRAASPLDRRQCSSPSLPVPCVVSVAVTRPSVTALVRAPSGAGVRRPVTEAITPWHLSG